MNYIIIKLSVCFFKTLKKIKKIIKKVEKKERSNRFLQIEGIFITDIYQVEITTSLLPEL